MSQRYVYGASSVVAIDSPSIKNSTKDMPLSSFASTVKLTVPATVCPFVGLDMTTIGGLVSFGILFTYTLIDGTSKILPDRSAILAPTMWFKSSASAEVSQSYSYGSSVSVLTSTLSM